MISEKNPICWRQMVRFPGLNRFMKVCFGNEYFEATAEGDHNTPNQKHRHPPRGLVAMADPMPGVVACGFSSFSLYSHPHHGVYA